MTAKDVIDCLQALNGYVITLGRLGFVELLLQDSIDAKLLAARNGYTLINLSVNIENILIKFLNKKKKPVKWDNETSNHITKAIKTNDLAIVLKLKNDYEVSCANIISSLKNNFKNDPLLDQFSGILELLTIVFKGKDDIITSKFKSLDTQGNKNPQKILRGPVRMRIDKVFEPSYSILENPVPEFGDTLQEIVPYFWSLSLREILASELCALSVIEYDNLPLQFYWDFSKQSWDEARHAKAYLSLAISFFNTIEDSLRNDDPLHQVIIEFKKNQKGLPVPREKNMYEAVLNAELEERLILMNILTEGPAIGRLAGKMKKTICIHYPEIKRMLEFDKIDETFHAGIGNHWLKYLIPDPVARKQKMEDTKLLRGFLLLSSIAEYSDSDLSKMAVNLAQN